MKKIHLPFQNLSPKGWINIAIAAAITFYIIQISFFIFDGTICKDYAFDYCAFWSAGEVTNSHNYVDIYNMNILKEFQKNIYPYEPGENTIFFGCPVPYLPIFLIPFKFLSMIELSYSFIIWTLINLIGFILYIRFFIKKTLGNTFSWRLFLLLFLALPVFINFREGQVNVILMIFTGEFIRAVLEGKSVKAGLWLGGWLLKPQLLILIIPVLLIRRSNKEFLGFVISSASITLISLFMININGFIALRNLLFEYSQGIATNNITAMMNWRMVGWHISSISSSTLGWVITILGTLTTAGVTLFFFRNREKAKSSKTVIGFLGIFAATCAGTWHSHLHMAVILIPGFAYLLTKNKINQNLFTAWVFFPVLGEFIGMIIAYFLQRGGFFQSSFEIIALARGFPGFLFNLVLLGWAINEYYVSNKNQVPQSV